MRSRRERYFERLGEILDRLIEKLDELPQVFTAEEALVGLFDLSDPNTKDEVFKKTVSLLGTIKTSALIAQTLLIQTNLAKPLESHKKYTAVVSITCLPQESGRWVATAYMGVNENVLAYGNSKKQAIAEALRAIANLLENTAT